MARNALRSAWNLFLRRPFALIVLVTLMQLILVAGFLLWAGLMGNAASNMLAAGSAVWMKYPLYTEKAVLLGLLIAALAIPFAMGGVDGTIGDLVRSGDFSLLRFAAHGLRFYGRFLAVGGLVAVVAFTLSSILLAFLPAVAALIGLQIMLVLVFMPFLFYLQAAIVLEDQGILPAIRSALTRYIGFPGPTLLLALALAGLLLLASILQQFLSSQNLLSMLPPVLSAPISLLAFLFLIALVGFTQSFVILTWFYAYTGGGSESSPANRQG